MEASAEAQVVASLRSQGYIPLAVERGLVQLGKKRGFSLKLPDLRPGRRVKNRDLMMFTRELATLLRAGMPLDRSLQSLATLVDQPDAQRERRPACSRRCRPENRSRRRWRSIAPSSRRCM